MIPSRIARHVREQNWTAIGIDFLIVVLGIVIGFQVTDWGQRRADRAREQDYLRQLDSDLRESVRTLDRFDAEHARGYRSANRLAGSFYDPDPAPRESLLVWLGASNSLGAVRPVTGTAEALVATGDLNLVRDDSLRAAITEYLAQWELINAYMEGNAALAIPYGIELGRRVDTGEALAVELVPVRDSLEAAGWALPFPEGASASPFPLDVEAFYADRELYFGLMALYQGRRALRYNREAFRRRLAAVQARMDRAAPPDSER